MKPDRHRSEVPSQGLLQVLGVDMLALKTHNNVVVTGSPGHQLQQEIGVVKGPHGKTDDRLARRIIALANTQRLSQKAQYTGQQIHPRGCASPKTVASLSDAA